MRDTYYADQEGLSVVRGRCGLRLRRLRSCTMYRVQGAMRDTYYADQEEPRRQSNLEAPRVTLGNKRMMNIQLPGGEVVQGIRTNKDLGYDGAPEARAHPQAPGHHRRGQARAPAAPAARHGGPDARAGGGRAHAPDDAPAPVPADALDGPRPALHGPAHVRGRLPHRPAEPDQDEEPAVPAELRHGGHAP